MALRRSAGQHVGPPQRRGTAAGLRVWTVLLPWLVAGVWVGGDAAAGPPLRTLQPAAAEQAPASPPAPPRAFDVNAPPPVIAIPSTRAILPRASALTSEQARRLIDALGSSDPRSRESAVDALMELSADDLPVLREAAAEARPLSPQTGPLLKDVVTHVFLRYRPYDAQPDSAFLGITLAPVTLPAVQSVQAVEARRGVAAEPPGQAVEWSDVPLGIAVTSRMPGLAGFRYLLDGDIVVSVSPADAGTGEPRPAVLGFRSTEEFAAQIRGRRPGERVRLGVVRGGRVVEVEVELSARPVRMEEFNSAETLRSERLTAAREYWEREWQPVLEGSRTDATGEEPGRTGG
ncbi:MAG: hypothetical protein ACK4PI_11520 [Tepidisphaerales bacterium]